MSVFTPLLRRPLSTSSTLTRSLLTPVRAFSCTPTPRIAKVTLIGNIAADAERVPTSSGQDMIKYSVASQAGTRDNPRTNFFNVVAFEDNEPRRDFLAGLTKGFLLIRFGAPTDV
ncbi:MAG: hypothetical protein M1817_006385 [Caeruleum heppii]|nr:MAG: hypothetical protein M1817_006385 [Caeruleum heppii]